MTVNIFGSGIDEFYDILRDLDLNSNTIHNVKDPENELDVANNRYVDSKSSSGNGWTWEGNALQSDGKIGSLNDNSLTFVRNNIPQMAFLSRHIAIYKSFYLEKKTMKVVIWGCNHQLIIRNLVFFLAITEI